jgi:uncharacterized protein YndB with AHSA1/START domain
MPQTEGKQNPVRQSVRVDCSPEEAFRLFTEAFGEWWPLGLHSVTGGDAEICVIEPWPGGRIFERTRSGEEHDWGCVTRCDPPARLSFTCDPGGIGSASQAVDVEFSPDSDGTRVTVIHTGWDAAGIAVCGLQADSRAMWLALLDGHFSRFVAGQMLVLS